MRITELEPRNPSEICVRCGLCCVALHATCTREEAVELCEVRHESLEGFAEELVYEQDGDDHNKGDPILKNGMPSVHIKFPCRYLRGRLMYAVACAVYGDPRPEVCRSYLCKIAIQFKAREVTLDEGLSKLRSAYWQNDASVFNWSGSSGEAVLSLTSDALDAVAEMKREGIPSVMIDYEIAAGVTPLYVPESRHDLNLTSMHFHAFDHREALRKRVDAEAIDESALGLYFSAEAIAEMSDGYKTAAASGIRAVLLEMRDLVVNSEKHLSDAAQYERCHTQQEMPEASPDAAAVCVRSPSSEENLEQVSNMDLGDLMEAALGGIRSEEES